MELSKAEAAQKSGFSRFLLSAAIILVIAGLVVIETSKIDDKVTIGIGLGIILVGTVSGFWYACRELPGGEQ